MNRQASLKKCETPSGSMTIQQLQNLGLTGYRHLKCHEQLSCQAAFPLQMRFPGVMGLCVRSNLVTAQTIAGQLVKASLANLEPNAAERERLVEWEQSLSDGSASLHDIYLGLEEFFDTHAEESTEEWTAEDLSVELESLLGLCSGGAWNV
jgi:hypothetical protein